MFALVLCLVLLANATAAIKFIEVEGKCEDLKPVKNYSQSDYIAEPWNVVKASWTEDGDTCVKMTSREGEGNDLLITTTSFNTKTQEMSSSEDKYVHLQDGSYIGPDGVSIEIVTHMDHKNYEVCIACKTVDGKAQVFATYSTRSGKIDKDAKAVFKQADKEFVDWGLAVPLNDVPHENCKTE